MMYDSDFTSFSIYSILEADDDDNATGNETQPADDAQDTGEDNAEAPANDEGGDDAAEDAGDDEFDIDTSVDTEDDTNDEGGGDTSPSVSSGDTDTNSMSDGEEEANPINTAIFDSLTPEEQAIKIKELKAMYKELYVSVTDMANRLQKMRLGEDTLDVMNRLNTDLYTFRHSLIDYFTNTFDTKSYIENDIEFGKFLYYLNSIKSVMEDIASTNEKIHGEDTAKR